MSRIRITPLADQDLVEIWYFIAQDDPVAADRLLDLLEEKYKLTRGQSAHGTCATRYCKRAALSPSRKLSAAISRNSQRD
jgi:plasmid stabilization system protein ParE